MRKWLFVAFTLRPSWLISAIDAALQKALQKWGLILTSYVITITCSHVGFGYRCNISTSTPGFPMHISSFARFYVHGTSAGSFAHLSRFRVFRYLGWPINHASSLCSNETLAITIERLLRSTILLFVSRSLFLFFANLIRTLKKVLNIVSSR